MTAETFLHGVEVDEVASTLTCAKVYAGALDNGASSYNAKMRAVPGIANTLLYTCGLAGNETLAAPSNCPLKISSNGGASWSSVANVVDAWDFGFGLNPNGGSTPSLFVAGWVNSVWGIYRSDDLGTSWIAYRNSQFPRGLLDSVMTIEGDMNAAQRVFLGFAGSTYTVLSAP